jgi:hypothetical protein
MHAYGIFDNHARLTYVKSPDIVYKHSWSLNLSTMNLLQLTSELFYKCPHIGCLVRT